MVVTKRETLGLDKSTEHVSAIQSASRSPNKTPPNRHLIVTQDQSGNDHEA